MRSFALGLRFVLEILALVAVGMYAWVTFDGAYAWIGAIGLPLLMLALWGTFNVPGDPSRGGGAPFGVSGVAHALLEDRIRWLLSQPSPRRG